MITEEDLAEIVFFTGLGGKKEGDEDGIDTRCDVQH